MPELEPGPEDENAPTKMPAEFGLTTATFVIAASMVGVGGAHDLGFDGLSHAEQPVDAPSSGFLAV